MIKKFLLTFTSIMLLTPNMTYAQNLGCAQRDSIVERLLNKYGETQSAKGLNFNNAITETFVNKSTGTWTILVTTPNGISCVVDGGKLWNVNDEVLPEGEPT